MARARLRVMNTEEINQALDLAEQDRQHAFSTGCCPRHNMKMVPVYRIGSEGALQVYECPECGFMARRPTNSEESRAFSEYIQRKPGY